MGISPFSNCTSNTVYVTNGTGSTRDGNPNKYRFKISQRVEFGKYLAVKINYPDCTNYTGDKILVYRDKYKFDKLLKSGAVDPHFLKDSYSPTARFEPPKTGWIFALAFAKMIFETDKKRN